MSEIRSKAGRFESGLTPPKTPVHYSAETVRNGPATQPTRWWPCHADETAATGRTGHDDSITTNENGFSSANLPRLPGAMGRSLASHLAHAGRSSTGFNPGRHRRGGRCLHVLHAGRGNRVSRWPPHRSVVPGVVPGEQRELISRLDNSRRNQKKTTISRPRSDKNRGWKKLGNHRSIQLSYGSNRGFSTFFRRCCVRCCVVFFGIPQPLSEGVGLDCRIVSHRGIDTFVTHQLLQFAGIHLPRPY